MRLNKGLLAILALAFFLRIWGVTFGLPHLYHADEPIVVNHAVAYGSGDFHPHFFKIPPLASYLLFLVYGLYFVAGMAAGLFKSLGDFQYLFLNDPASFYAVGRILLGVLPGTLTVYFLYRLISQNFSYGRGIVSAFFLSVAYLHVRDSHYIYPDVWLTAVIAGSFFYIFKILKMCRPRDCLVFGALAGLATAIKYNGIFILIPFVAALVMRYREHKDTKEFFVNLVSAGFTGALAYGFLNPYSILDGRFFLRELLTQAGAQGFVGFFHHWRYSLQEGLGAPLWVFSTAGLLTALFLREKKRLLIASFVIFYYFPVLVFMSQHYDRYVLPLIPFACFFAADLLLSYFAENKIASLRILWLAAVTFAVPSLVKCLLLNELLSVKDIRTVAVEWIEKTVPEGTAIALDDPFFMPRLKPTLAQLEEKRKTVTRGSGESSQGKRLKHLVEDAVRHPEKKRFTLYFMQDDPAKKGFLFTQPTVLYDTYFIRQAGVQYVIMTRAHRNQNRVFYDRLRQEGKLVQRFSPYRDWLREEAIDTFALTGAPFLTEELRERERNGQIIEIYQL